MTKLSFNKTFFTIIAVLSTVVIAAVPTQADVVPVVNGGFDVTSPSDSTPFTLGSSPDGSAIYASAFDSNPSTANPVTFNYAGTASGPASGNVLGFTGSSLGSFSEQILGSNYVDPGTSSGFAASVEGGTLSETLTSDLLANSTYTLTFAAAVRKDQNDPGAAFTADLSAGGVVLGTLTPSTTVQGLTTTFQNYTLTYSDIGALNAPVGDALTIDFNNTLSGSEQALVDNVSLDVEGPSTPEPSTYALMLAGIGTLALVARLRRQNV
jgi:hypothetical protein